MKEEICLFCKKPIRTKKSKVTIFSDEDDTLTPIGKAHKRCVLANGGEEIPTGDPTICIMESKKK